MWCSLRILNPRSPGGSLFIAEKRTLVRLGCNPEPVSKQLRQLDGTVDHVEGTHAEIGDAKVKPTCGNLRFEQPQIFQVRLVDVIEAYVYSMNALEGALSAPFRAALSGLRAIVSLFQGRMKLFPNLLSVQANKSWYRLSDKDARSGCYRLESPFFLSKFVVYSVILGGCTISAVFTRPGSNATAKLSGDGGR